MNPKADNAQKRQVYSEYLQRSSQSSWGGISQGKVSETGERVELVHGEVCDDKRLNGENRIWLTCRACYQTIIIFNPSMYKSMF